MKNLLFSLAFALGTLALPAQVPSETRTPGDFTGIRVSSIVALELTQGETNTVTVEASAENLSKVSTEVSDGILVISAHNLNNIGDEGIKVKVTVKNLTSLEASSASSVKSTNQLTSEKLRIEGSGAASIRLDIKTTSVKLVLSGANTTRLSGSATNLEAELSGAAGLKAYQLQSDNVTVTTSGAASAHVTANVKLVANATGASEIHYQGTATEKTVNATGSSSIGMRSGDNPESDTTTVRIGNYNVHVTETDDNEDQRSDREKKADDEDFHFWSGLDLGVNGYLSAGNKLELPAGHEFLELNYAKSYVFGWNAFQKNIHIYRNNVNLGTGIGLTWYHYNFRNSYTLQPNVSYAAATPDSLKYLKNRLNMCYVNVPLFFEFNTNNKDARNSFHIGAGMQFGYNIFNNKLKQKYELDDHTYKNKTKDDFNVNPFRYDVIARIGYGNFSIFGTYSLSTLFEQGKGPVVYPFAAGIHIDM